MTNMQSWKKYNEAKLTKGRALVEMNRAIVAIATDEAGPLRLDTVETRKSDGLDFYDCAVWSIKEAMEKAYAAGYLAGAGRRPVGWCDNDGSPELNTVKI